jgi:hypothetical protein
MRVSCAPASIRSCYSRLPHASNVSASPEERNARGEKVWCELHRSVNLKQPVGFGCVIPPPIYVYQYFDLRAIALQAMVDRPRKRLTRME